MINVHFLLIMAVGEDRIYHMFNLVEIIIIIMVVFQYYTKLNPSISKTIRGISLQFCTQVGSDDSMCSDLLV